MTRNELITPDGELRCRQLRIGEEYQIGDWFFRADGTKVVLNQQAMDMLGSSVGMKFVTAGDIPAYRNIEEQPK